MADSITRRMIAAYEQRSAPTMFFSSFFRTAPENFHSSQEVELDIVRCEEDVSIVIQDLTTGYRKNSDDIYTNKSFVPPIHKESIVLSSSDLLKRMAGKNPYESPDFRADVLMKMFSGMEKVERKIRRSIELQASQVLQTGVVTLTDASGATLYTLNFSPKGTHFPTVATAWDQALADPLGDISSLAEIIRSDGLASPDQLIMGITAFEAFIKNNDVISRFDTRRYELGTIAAARVTGEGGSYRGTVEVGNYRYDVWTYGGKYKDPQTGLSVDYMDPGKVIVRASTGRLDATFGAIPNIGQIFGGGANRLIPELPSRIASASRGIDLFTNVWMTEDGEHLMGGVGTRPLMIPTAIDTYGCIDTQL